MSGDDHGWEAYKDAFPAGKNIRESGAQAMTDLDRLDAPTDWKDQRQRDFTRENIARHPDSMWPYRSILPLLDALDSLVAENKALREAAEAVDAAWVVSDNGWDYAPEMEFRLRDLRAALHHKDGAS